MGYQMEWKLNTESVIARLMGLDQLRPRQRVYENRRVLSDGYIRKVATIGLRQGSLVSIGRSCGSKKEKVDAVKDVSRITSMEGQKNNIDCNKCESSNASAGLGTLKPSGASLSKSLSKTCCEDKRSLGERDDHCTQGNDHCTQGNGLRYVQKPEDDWVAGRQGEQGIHYANKTLEFGSEMVMMTASMEPKLEKVTYGFRDGISDRHSELGYREQNDSLRPEIGNHHHHALISEKLVVNDITPLQCSCIGCAENKSKVSQKVWAGRKFAELSIPGHKGDNQLANVDMETGHASPLSPSQASPKKQIFERWTTRTKVVRRIDFSERGTSPKMLALADKESTFGKGKDFLSNDWNLKQHYSMYKSVVDNLEPKGGTNCDQFQTSPSVNGDTLPLSSKISADIQSIHDEKNNGSENYNSAEIELSQRNSILTIGNISFQSKVDTSYASAEGGHSFDVPQDFIEEAVGNEFSEELADSNSSRIGTPEFQENLKRAANQNSPDSVLKPFYGECYSNDQCFDSIGLQLQLQVLNLETGDSCSEESVMGAFGDEDSVEYLADTSVDIKKVKRWLGDKESRNFSYMVDVLDKAGFSSTKPCMDSKTWHSLESPISPLVFEALEKKYGKQASWERLDRQLLFDSINSGLFGIFNPVIMNFNPSIKRFLRANLRRDEVEDELWTVLISQETERGNASSEKVLEEWVETNEGMSIICTELVTSFFDELVEELVGLLIS